MQEEEEKRGLMNSITNQYFLLKGAPKEINSGKSLVCEVLPMSEPEKPKFIKPQEPLFFDQSSIFSDVSFII